MWKCGSCGYSNPDGSKYCGRCGKSIQQGSISKNKISLRKTIALTCLLIACVIGMWVYKNIIHHEHVWNKPTYTWANDNSYVTATRTCMNDVRKDHVETETVSTYSRETIKATCEVRGQITYSSDTFANKAFVKQEKTVETNMVSHKWEPATCSKPRTCSVCGATEGTALGHDWGSWVTVRNATCELSGMQERVCRNNSAHVERKEVAALGHKWTAATYSSPSTCTRCGTTQGSALRTPTPSTAPPKVYPEYPSSPYGEALKDNMKYGTYYSDEKKVEIVSDTFYNRKTADGKHKSWYHSTYRDDIYPGYRVELYYADGLLFFANLTRNSKNQVTLHYWGDQMIACRDLRGSNQNLSYAGSTIYKKVMSEFGDLYSIAMRYAP